MCIDAGIPFWARNQLISNSQKLYQLFNIKLSKLFKNRIVFLRLKKRRMEEILCEKGKLEIIKKTAYIVLISKMYEKFYTEL